MTVGSGSCVTTAPLSSIAPRRLTSACIRASSLEVSASSLPLRPDARIGQQVLDQALHAAGAVDGEGDELVGVGVQPSLVASRQQLRVARHHAQRLLQIVRGDVGELAQFLVRAVQLLHLLQEMRFGLLAHADVADRRRHQDAVGALQRAQHDLDRKLAAVLAPPRAVRCRCRSAAPARLPPSAARRRRSRSAKPSGMMFVTFWPDQLVAAVAELLLRLHVQQDDLAGRGRPPPSRRAPLPADRDSGPPSAPGAPRPPCAR